MSDCSRRAWAVPDRDALVRCRECRFMKETRAGLVCALRYGAWYATESDGFCHRAKRREPVPKP